MGLEIQYFGHASFSLVGGVALYIDPWQLGMVEIGPDFILVSHSHPRHFSPVDIDHLAVKNTRIFGPAQVIENLGSGRGKVLLPHREILDTQVRIKGVPAYNRRSEVHKKSDKGLGFIIEIQGKRIYYAGDTDYIAEMEERGPIDVALLPVGGRSVMGYNDAAKAVRIIKPKLAIPYHYGDREETFLAGESFSNLADCIVRVLVPGDKINLL
ncbi:MAG: MBL fold metallo-hydrolase [Spirochaetales bacterium]|nr:MBL fold metallo-hydrolase [Spirochaetales bacterium]